MTGLAKISFKPSQLYSGAGDHHLNTAANQDCSNCGQPLTGRATRGTTWLGNGATDVFNIHTEAGAGFANQAMSADTALPGEK